MPRPCSCIQPRFTCARAWLRAAAVATVVLVTLMGMTGFAANPALGPAMQMLETNTNLRMAANPLLGRLADRVTAARGTVLLTEVPEMFAAERAGSSSGK